MALFDNHTRLIESARLVRVVGTVTGVTGTHIETSGIHLPVGSFVEIERNGDDVIPAQIVSLRGQSQVVIPMSDSAGVRVGARATSAAGFEHVPVSTRMLGAILDGMGRPIGGRRDFSPEAYYPVITNAPAPLERREIDAILPTGIKAIDAMHTLGGGQRIGVFAGTGVGKSVLMGMIARYTQADVTVVALIGERGREVGDFIRKDLGEEGAQKCVLVVSTSNESPVLRLRAGFVATAVAEFFRDQGANVLLMMDSTTRIAMAQREIGLAAGEPPTTKGYPPSVYGLLPRMLERSGRTKSGSITGLYTVLVEGDDINEPISDAMRGILDGHVWLSRDLANRGQYPAIAVLDGVSRVMPDVIDDEHMKAARTVRKTLAVWRDIEDLVNLGAYTKGANADFDVAVEMKPRIDAYLQQDVGMRASWTELRNEFIELAAAITTRREELDNTGREVEATPN
ncbi:MAG: FliI/YscN family ATPase [Planctomycetota bacterium]